MGIESNNSRFGLRVERVWVWKRGQEIFAREGARPCPEAVEYMRVLSRPEVESLAAAEGVDTQQLLNSYLRTIEGQRRHIAQLEERAATGGGYQSRYEDGVPLPPPRKP